MNKIYSIPALIVFTLIISCSCKTVKESKTSVENSQLEQDSNITNIATQDTIKHTEEITVFATISKSPCYGTCPVYNMTIFSDGSITLEGIRIIDKIGTFYGKITKEQLAEFEKVANEINYFDLKDEYDSPVTDLPSTTTSIIVNGEKKKVRRRANYPQGILTFEILFENLLNSVDWEKKN